MKQINSPIPYCGNCMRKSKKNGLHPDEYYCEVLANTPMKGIVTPDIDGWDCVKQGLYIPLKE